MPLCYSNFKSFRNKSSRIFWFEQLLFSKVDKLICKGQVGLGLTGKGRWRDNTGCNQLSDAIGNSHANSIKIEGCPCKLWQPYYPSNTYWGCDLNATLGVKVILGLMLLSIKLLYCLQLLSNSAPGRGWPKCYVQSHRWPIGQCCLEANYFIFSGSIQFNAWVRVANVHVPCLYHRLT